MTDDKQVVWQKEGSWRFEVVPLIKPDGSLTGRPVIRHPGAAVLVPLTAAQEILMLRQYRYGVDQVIWEVPAGTREWGEDWLVCAQRELREEAGVRAEQFTHLCDLWPTPGLSDEVLRVYLAEGLTDDPLPADFDEQIEVVTVPLADVVAMAYDGRIQDAKTIAVILRAAHHIGQS